MTVPRTPEQLAETVREFLVAPLSVSNDEQQKKAEDALAELLARLQDAKRERDEWKREAELSKWPKEAAAEYHHMKVALPAAEARVKELEAALRAWNDDAAIASGYAAVRKMLMLRVGDQRQHGEAFRAAALAVSRGTPEAKETE